MRNNRFEGFLKRREPHKPNIERGGGCKVMVKVEGLIIVALLLIGLILPISTVVAQDSEKLKLEVQLKAYREMIKRALAYANISEIPEDVYEEALRIANLTDDEIASMALDDLEELLELAKETYGHLTLKITVKVNEKSRVEKIIKIVLKVNEKYGVNVEEEIPEIKNVTKALRENRTDYALKVLQKVKEKVKTIRAEKAAEELRNVTAKYVETTLKLENATEPEERIAGVLENLNKTVEVLEKVRELLEAANASKVAISAISMSIENLKKVGEIVKTVIVEVKEKTKENVEKKVKEEVGEKLEEVREEINELKKHVEELITEAEESNETEIIALLEELMNKLVGLETEINETPIENISITLLMKVDNEVAKVKVEVKSIEVKIEALKEEREELREEARELLEKLRKCLNETMELMEKAENLNMSETYAELNSVRVRLEAMIKNLGENVTLKVMEQVKLELHGVKEFIEKAKEEIGGAEEVQSKVEEVNAECLELQKKLEDLKSKAANVTEVMQEIEDVEEKLSEYCTIVKNITLEETEEAKKAIVEAENYLEGLKRKVEELESKISELEEEKQSTQQINVTETSELEEYEKKLEEYNKTLGEVKAKIDELEEKAEEKHGMQIMPQITQMKLQTSEVEEYIKNAEKCLEENDVECLKELIEEIEKLLEQILNNIENLEENLS